MPNPRYEALTTAVHVPSIVIATTLDTKHAEAACMREALAAEGLNTILIDCGILSDPSLTPDISAGEVAALGGVSLDELRSRHDRAVAIETMTTGLAACLDMLGRRGVISGFLALGGGTNTALAAAAFRQLPYGVPKLLVATTVSGNTAPILDAKDVVLIHSVVDILGTGPYLKALFKRSAKVMNALVNTVDDYPASKDSIGVTAFGSTTAAAERIFDLLSAAGHDVLTFHARGSGGRAVEAFLRDHRLRLMLDLTTTEIADEVVGGTMSAGPTRLEAAVEMGVPQVLLPGAIDMVNFGPLETVPAKFADRLLLSHTPQTTLMRTSAAEVADVARIMAAKLERALAPATFIVPMQGFSAYDKAGAPFFDPAADKAFVEALESSLRSDIPIMKIDAHINDPMVADIAVDILLKSAAAAN